MIDLKRLRYFVTVAEELHFGRAAKRLNMSQPPLSQQIRALEQELGVILFNRTRRSVELTPVGRVLLERARRLVRDAGDMQEAARRAEQAGVGQLTVAFVHSAGYSVLPPLVRTFRENSPGVMLALREQTAAEQVEELARGRIDVGLSRPAAFGPGTTVETILREPFVLALPSDHWAAAEPQLELSALRSEEFITFPRSRAPAFYEAIVLLCGRAGFVPRSSQETNTIHTALGLVASGVGIAVVPASARQIPVPHVVFRALPDGEPLAELVMAWRPDRCSSTLKRFLDDARAVAGVYEAGQSPVRKPSPPGR